MSRSTTTYWAAEQSDTFASSLEERIDAYYRHLTTSGRLALWQKVHKQFHAGGYDMGRIRVGGDADQLTLMKANHLRNICKHTVNLVTAQRPAFDCQAGSYSYESEKECALGQSILDFDMKAKHLEQVARQVVSYAIQAGEGWGLKVWDTSGGEPWGIDPATGQPIPTGVLKYHAVHPCDLVRDVTSEAKLQGLRWGAVRRWENRHDLVAKYASKGEDVVDAIMSAPRKSEIIHKHYLLARDWSLEVMPLDEVEVFEFYHARTEALPDGRRALWVAGKVVDDGPLPYRRMPLFPCFADYQKESAFGYSIAYDLSPIQDAVDALVSTIASNQAAFGVQSILVPKGHAISVNQLSKGLQALTFDPGLGPPVPLNLVKTSPETFQFIGVLVQFMETLSGISSVVRGDPQASLKSGSALAMVASQALQYSVDLQAAYVAFLENIGTGAIEDYQDFATLPQVVQLTGEGSVGYAQEWKGQDIQRITRVTVDVGNALSKTLAGRSEIATQLVQAGLIPDARTYIEVLTTGRLDALTRDTMSEMLLVRSENERLSKGIACQALATDDHALHIRQHRQVTASPASRENPELVQATLDHMQQHIELLRSVDPLLLSTLGIPVPPDHQMAMDPNADPDAEGPGAPPPGAPQPPGPASGAGVPQMPNMPNMPVNPATGQRMPAPKRSENLIPPGVGPASEVPGPF